MKHVNCDFCKKNDTEKVFLIQIFLNNKKETFNLVRCKNCGLVYVNPQPEPNEVSSYYPQEEYYSYSQLDRKLENRLSFLERLRDYITQKAILRYYKGDLSSLSKLQKGLNRIVILLGENRLAAHSVTPDYIKKGKILDIGCGDGIFLDSLKKIGWETFGVEISEVAVKNGQARGLNILNKDLLETDFPPDSFDVVRMWSVLEHLHRPYETLREIHRILRPGGTLIAQMPNFDSLASRIFKERWAGLTTDLHLHHFNSKMLRDILGKSGFMVSKIYTSSVGTLGGSLKLGKIYYLIAPLIAFFDFLLDKLGVGDCLVVFAKKES